MTEESIILKNVSREDASGGVGAGVSGATDDTILGIEIQNMGTMLATESQSIHGRRHYGIFKL